MDERRDLVDREELRRRIAEDPFALDDELVEAAAAALFSYWHGPAWDDVQANPIVSQYREQARAVLSVPALRDALARDAQVREIVERQDKLVLDQAIGFIQIRSLHHAGDGWGVWAEDDIPATMLRPTLTNRGTR